MAFSHQPIALTYHTHMLTMQRVFMYVKQLNVHEVCKSMNRWMRGSI